MSSALTIDPVTPTVGAAIRGIDLRDPVSADLADEIHAALMTHLVVWFPDQEIAPETPLNLARAMGPLADRHPLYETHPDHPDVVILDWGEDRRPDADEWHTDMRFRTDWPFASVLQAVQIPATGGDTLWANMYRAYETLPAGIREEIADLKAVHDMGAFRRRYIEQGGAEALSEGMAEFGSAVHPVVDLHPFTGRPYLNVNESFTTYIDGLSFPESQRLLSYLLAHINRPDHQVRLRWQPGTVAMWDNGASQHYAVNDYLPNRRVMYRVVVARDARCTS